MEFTVKISKTALNKLRKLFITNFDYEPEDLIADEKVFREFFYVSHQHGAELDLRDTVKITKISD